jgi:hypothetical protein
MSACKASASYLYFIWFYGVLGNVHCTDKIVLHNTCMKATAKEPRGYEDY